LFWQSIWRQAGCRSYGACGETQRLRRQRRYHSPESKGARGRAGRISELSSLKGCENKAQGKRSAALGLRSKIILCPVGAPQNGTPQHFWRSFRAPTTHHSEPKASLCSALGFALSALQAGASEFQKLRCAQMGAKQLQHGSIRTGEPLKASSIRVHSCHSCKNPVRFPPVKLIRVYLCSSVVKTSFPRLGYPTNSDRFQPIQP
jgi:hypothetical protein